MCLLRATVEWLLNASLNLPAHPDARVDDPTTRPRRQHDHGIEIQFGDFRQLLCQSGNAQQEFLQCIDVGRGVSAVTLEKTMGANLQEFVGVAIRQRSDPEADIPENFGVNATQAKSNERPEQGIVHDADDGFDAALDHRLNQHALDCRREAIRPGTFEQLVECFANGALVVEVHADAADIALVNQRWRNQFRDDGEAE